MAQVLLADVLGAAVLALVLLYRNQQRQAARLAKIEAEFAAEKIARLTQQLAPPAMPAEEEEEPEEPARRKRHLALYIGGGVAAIFSSLGARLRSAWKRSPALTTTGTVAVVAVASTAAASYLPADSTTPDTPSAPHPATVSDPPKADALDAPGPPSGARSTDDDRAGANDAPYQTTEVGSFKMLGPSEEKPSAPTASSGVQGQPQKGDQPSQPDQPTSPGPSPSDPGPGPSDPGPATPPLSHGPDGSARGHREAMV